MTYCRERRPVCGELLILGKSVIRHTHHRVAAARASASVKDGDSRYARQKGKGMKTRGNPSAPWDNAPFSEAGFPDAPGIAIALTSAGTMCRLAVVSSGRETDEAILG